MKLHALSLALLLFLPRADAAAAQPRLPVSLAAFVLLLFMLALRRLWSYAGRRLA